MRPHSSGSPKTPYSARNAGCGDRVAAIWQYAGRVGAPTLRHAAIEGLADIEPESEPVKLFAVW